jgi:hypothetical protein
MGKYCKAYLLKNLRQFVSGLRELKMSEKTLTAQGFYLLFRRCLLSLLGKRLVTGTSQASC